MPKSKRDKIVHLTKVKKKGKDHKEDLIKQIEEYAKQYKRVFIFDFEKSKSDEIMALRVKLKGEGRIYAGKNSLVSASLKALGEKDNIDYSKIIKHVTGHRGLLFTNMEHKRLVEFLESEKPEFLKKLLCHSTLGSNPCKIKMHRC